MTSLFGASGHLFPGKNADSGEQQAADVSTPFPGTGPIQANTPRRNPLVEDPGYDLREISLPGIRLMPTAEEELLRSANLTPRQREALFLRYASELALSDVAMVMGISINVARLHVKHGRLRLIEAACRFKPDDDTINWQALLLDMLDLGEFASLSELSR